MNTPNTKGNQAKITKAGIDFSHRLSTLMESDESLSTNDMLSTLFLMCASAIGIVEVIALQFEDGAAISSNENNSAALLAVSCEIMDIRALLKTLSDVLKENTGQ